MFRHTLFKVIGNGHNPVKFAVLACHLGERPIHYLVFLLDTIWANKHYKHVDSDSQQPGNSEGNENQRGPRYTQNVCAILCARCWWCCSNIRINARDECVPMRNSRSRVGYSGGRRDVTAKDDAGPGENIASQWMAFAPDDTVCMCIEDKSCLIVA